MNGFGGRVLKPVIRVRGIVAVVILMVIVASLNVPITPLHRIALSLLNAVSLGILAGGEAHELKLDLRLQLVIGAVGAFVGFFFVYFGLPNVIQIPPP